MDPKSTYPVVKFLVAATNFKKQDARRMLEEISEDRYSQLFIRALEWERDTEGKASKMLSEILGDGHLSTLMAATRRARRPATATEDADDNDGGDAAPQRRSTKPKTPARRR